MAYKKLIKVSNVCQLLDKRKYYPTRTINGVTFTNNGDGTITVNGTATDRVVYRVYTASYFPSTSIGHKCLIESNVPFLDTNIIDLHAVAWEYSISKPIGTITESNIYISVYKGYTVNNLVFKPQLFDLTEMYGAGNEPTTVAQFRQDFPEEMYDYSPHCWLTSYKRVFMTGGGNYLTSYQRNLTCKTKNLLSFPYHSSYKTKYGITFSQVETYKVHASGINTTNVGNVFDFVYGKTFKAGTYTIKFYTEGNVTTDLYYIVRKDSYYGTSIGNTLTSKLTFTLSEDTVLFISFGIFGTNSPHYTGEELNVTVYCQLELGDTATEYVPYGHL